MYKNYNMTQLTLPMETSVLIPTNDISRHVNDIVETIPDNEFDEFRHSRGWKKSIQNHESKMNEDSKALYHELVTNKIIPEIKEDHDNELTKEEIDLIGSHLDKEIEDLNQHINNEKMY